MLLLENIHRHLRALSHGLSRHAYASENRFVVVGMVGFLGFPLYYIFWTYIFPQPYENLVLRSLGALLCAFLMIKDHWPAFLRKFIPWIWYGVICYTLPFFFTFMLLKNNNSNVWLMSTLAAIFLMVLLLDWLSLCLLFFIGSGLGWLCYLLSTHLLNQPLFYLQYLFIYMFVIVGGSIFNYKAALLQQEKLQGMAAASGNIAHELRTPLLGIKSGAIGLARYLPLLFEGYQLAKDAGLDVPRIRTAHYNALVPTLERIESETNYANTIIDMLLMNVGRESIDTKIFEICSAAACIDVALERYPFNSAMERDLISNDSAQDFEFFGSQILVVHILFNLIKNALYHIAEVKKGAISIWLQRGERFNYLYFKDTGAGIPPDVLHLLFDRFFTTTVSGTGIGLSFSHLVMSSIGGEIDCNSVFGEFTEFKLAFPHLPAPATTDPSATSIGTEIKTGTTTGTGTGTAGAATTLPPTNASLPHQGNQQ